MVFEDHVRLELGELHFRIAKIRQETELVVEENAKLREENRKLKEELSKEIRLPIELESK